MFILNFQAEIRIIIIIIIIMMMMMMMMMIMMMMMMIGIIMSCALHHTWSCNL